MASSTSARVIVGLGNPGPKHAGDRHNVGFWFVDQLAAHLGGRFTTEQKLQGDTCRVEIGGTTLRLLKPGTYMNRSGQSLRRLLDYYELPLEDVLVVHDELDLPPGIVRFKKGGGHGGHNGLRDLLAHCGPDFLRLRIGIGHPGHKDLVTNYVLSAPGKDDRTKILDGMAQALEAVDVLIASGVEKATTRLHTSLPRAGAGEFGPAG